MTDNFSINNLSQKEYENILEKCKEHLEVLQLIAECCNKGNMPEGGIYYKDKTYEPNPNAVNIQKNLIILSKKSQRILEIGFNMGHSCLFMLISNPECFIDCVDICEHSYVEYCFDYLQTKFPNRLKLWKGHSHDVLSFYNNIKEDKRELVDMVHIDGSHDYSIANIDFFLSRSKLRKKGIIVFDDTWLAHLNYLWCGYIKSGLIIPINNLYETLGNGCGHSIGLLNIPNVNIAVTSLSIGEEYKNIVKYGRKGKIMYCEKYGYDFREDEDIYDNSRPPAWSKVKLILKCLKETEDLEINLIDQFENKLNLSENILNLKGKTNDIKNPKYDYVVWLDSDSHIMNFDKRLEDFILEMKKDIMMVSDFERINSGVIFIKNTENSRKFFEKLYEMTDYINKDNWEQEAIIDMVKYNMFNCNDYVEILGCERQTEFNSYYGMYKDGQFLIHLAGCFRDGINKGLNAMMNRYCPLKMEEENQEEYEKRKVFLKSL